MMYFKQIDEIVSGKKTQTRRIVKPGEFPLNSHDFNIDQGVHWNKTIDAVSTAKCIRKWRVFGEYAVSPGRGKPGVWVFPGLGAKLPDEIWNVVTDHDCLTYHGVARDERSFFTQMGWKPLRIRITEIRREPLQAISEDDARAEGWPGVLECGDMPIPWYAKLWNSINTRKGTRWDDSPDVWVLTFEVV